MPLVRAGVFSVAYIQGEARGQHSLFPSTLDDLIPADHLCRVIEAFVSRLDFSALGFVRSEPAETGRPGYDPRDLLKLYLYGYLQQIRSSRRLEAECQRNVEVMWLLGRLAPDYKSIAEFRRMHRESVSEAGAELVRFARSVGLVRGEWVAIDGSKFRAVSSAGGVRERDAVKRYLDELERADEGEIVIDSSAVAAALEKLESHPEPEARFMRTTDGKRPAYNVQTAVDSEHSLIIAHEATTEANDLRCLQPMAEAAKQALGDPEKLNVVADTGYCNAEQFERCEAQGIVPHVPVQRGVNSQGDGTLFDRTEFHYDEKTDTFRCPTGNTLKRVALQVERKRVAYKAAKKHCRNCPLKSHCTNTNRRVVYRSLHENTLTRMQQRTTAEAMRLRRSTAEHPFATLKYRIFGHPRLLLRGLAGAQTEISLAVIGYNLKRMINILGAQRLTAALCG